MYNFLLKFKSETLENPNFIKNSKIVISIRNLEFFYIPDDEKDFTVGIVSRNLATKSRFQVFQGVGCRMTHGVASGCNMAP